MGRAVVADAPDRDGRLSAMGRTIIGRQFLFVSKSELSPLSALTWSVRISEYLPTRVDR